MKTRRIFLQPGEPVELINPFGTSVLKVTTQFEYEHPTIVLYEQPDVVILTPEQAKTRELTPEPKQKVTQSEPVQPFNPLEQSEEHF